MIDGIYRLHLVALKICFHHCITQHIHSPQFFKRTTELLLCTNTGNRRRHCRYQPYRNIQRFFQSPYRHHRRKSEYGRQSNHIETGNRSCQFHYQGLKRFFILQNSGNISGSHFCRTNPQSFQFRKIYGRNLALYPILLKAVSDKLRIEVKESGHIDNPNLLAGHVTYR